MCASLTNHASTKKLERQPATAHSGTFDRKTTFEQRNTIQLVCLSTSKWITRKAVWETSTIDVGGVERQNESHRSPRSVTASKLPSFRDRLHFLRHRSVFRSPVGLAGSVADTTGAC
jgi:hypothetical protein